MIRGQKKFIYGLFYLLILALIVWAFWPSAKSPVPPVCSGPSCGTDLPLPLRAQPATVIFRSENAHRAVAMASITNPNKDFGFYFSYEFQILNRDGATTTVISANDVVYPSETKYLLGIYDAGTSDLAYVADQAGFKITSSSSLPAANFLERDLVLTSGPLVQVDPGGIVVSGMLKNQGSSPVQNVKIVAVLNNRYGDSVFAAQTLIPSLAGFQEAAFQIPFPADQSIAGNIVADRTQIFLSTE